MNKGPGSSSFTDTYQNSKWLQNSMKHLKSLHLSFSNSYKKIAKEAILSNSFSESIITMIPKPDKDTTEKKKNTGEYHCEHRHKNPLQNTRNPNPTAH